MAEDSIMNETIKKYTDLIIRSTEKEYFHISDPDHILSVEDIDLLWVYFRTTETISLEKYPNISHLQGKSARITPEFMDKYRDIYPRLKTLWSKLLDDPKSFITFLGPFPNRTMATVAKDGDSFTFYYVRMIEESHKKFMDLVNPILQLVKYHVIFGRMGTYE